MTVSFSFVKMSSLLLVVVLLLPPQSSLGGVLGKVGITCEEQEKVDCLAGGVFNLDVGSTLSGTYMCREYSRLFGLLGKRNTTICVPTILNAVLGETGDVCGCCSGNCPKPCGCPCSYDGDFVDKVWVKRKVGLLKRKVEYECVSEGKASRWVADDWENYECVSDQECPTLAPTMAPTEEYVYVPPTSGDVMTESPVQVEDGSP